MPDKRSKGQRRWGLDQEFPVKDSNGVVVITERRQLTDRRLDNVLGNAGRRSRTH